MASPGERIVSALSYFTFGIFGIIWIVYVNVTKKPVTKFATYNVFQCMLVSLTLAVIAYAYDLLVYRFGVIIPILGKILRPFDLFFNQTPIYFGFTISGLIVTIFLFYLIVASLLGKKPFVPFISNIIDCNLGR